ncbi:IMS domain-containing protein [Pleurocapsa sp. CCALA 161]|uniref:IMS domain-containing protein n=1 Tax=Pleurocapsa sp. CCALA 161 TaxID=2107688 RepID=UPI001304CD39|nr:IMS domain-containing protein [Pleurocapsa sp. CCALA 161]
MRIPLDYYRILSVPVKANSAQLEQAYHDRLLQQPRREYSEETVKARQQLIEYSYQVLSNSEQRASYDAQFLLNMQPATPEAIKDKDDHSTVDEPDLAAQISPEEENIVLANPTIEISASQIVGALLILHELGEYETVLRLGIDEFNRRELEQQKHRASELSLDKTQEDLILVLTLAYMELGREQWHRREYESAALSSQLGIELLHQKSLFPHLQTELEQDLCKLRPYRVLELISRNPGKSAARTEGLKLLQSMLIQRQGIEGKGEDRSGLNFDQFLCFIQQLRTYLTSDEQQELFDNKSQSQSAIANYLSVYALLGRGFSLKRPELVSRAQRKLDYLSEKQDVSWEQAIAALLLGHIEKAINQLKNSADPSQLQQVQQHAIDNSEDSSDLLPGLCFYAQQWLLQDVLAQFVDLAPIELTLKEYFADPQVQAYVEQLAPPTMAENALNREGVSQPRAKRKTDANSKIRALWRNLFSGEKSTVSAAQVEFVAKELGGSSANHQSSATATMEREQAAAFSGFKPGEPISAQTTHQSSPKKSLLLPLEPKNTRAVPESVIHKAQKKARGKKAGQKKRSPRTIWQGWLFIISLILGIGTVSYLGMKLFLSPANKTASQEELAIALNQPSVEIPPQKTQSVTKKPAPQLTLTQQSQQAIQAWLSSKSAAFGKEHQIDRLNSILAEPLLTTWRASAKIYQQENIYREYEHSLVMRSAKIDPNNQNKATAEAEIKETAQHYQSGQLNNAESYDDKLLVRYQLIRQGEKWLIQQAEVLKTL